MPQNPCITCGACCAFFRVSFYWQETDDNMGEVPKDMTEPLNTFRQCMKGTNQLRPRCIALDGEIGHTVLCNIYTKRPSVCREFGVQWEDGWLYISADDFQRCTIARTKWGLAPIDPGFEPDKNTPIRWIEPVIDENDPDKDPPEIDFPDKIPA